MGTRYYKLHPWSNRRCWDSRVGGVVGWGTMERSHSRSMFGLMLPRCWLYGDALRFGAARCKSGLRRTEQKNQWCKDSRGFRPTESDISIAMDTFHHWLLSSTALGFAKKVLAIMDPSNGSNILASPVLHLVAGFGRCASDDSEQLERFFAPIWSKR